MEKPRLETWLLSTDATEVKDMIAFKSCPRCHGDLLIRPDEDEVTCLQCGHDLRPEQKQELLARLEKATRREPALAA